LSEEQEVTEVTVDFEQLIDGIRQQERNRVIKILQREHEWDAIDYLEKEWEKDKEQPTNDAT
jgi:hypothetical protein